ncbi:hypothetical protein HHK36_007774 [Tetracentron sinense]|uniref:SMARCC C-terminal domain-containing protein n=1 Tax=Tetracentron sinense TaxID=13715 RepID=A0A834ZNV0_TETSI|nr:hypothetical protein HHK36_007774 [Tetracentron sinense]
MIAIAGLSLYCLDSPTCTAVVSYKFALYMQLKRLELKLKQFAELETLLMKECEQVERMRQRLAAERARIISTRFGPSGATTPTSLPGVGTAVVNNNAGNNRQQVIPTSLSQTNISGYSNNQPSHPHMSFMPRQPMFGYGQRLPLSALHTSSSAPPANVMFTAPGNASPNLSHPMLRPVSGTNTNVG